MRNIYAILGLFLLYSTEGFGSNLILSLKCIGNVLQKKVIDDVEHRSNPHNSIRFYNLYDDHININTDGSISLIDKKRNIKNR